MICKLDALLWVRYVPLTHLSQVLGEPLQERGDSSKEQTMPWQVGNFHHAFCVSLEKPFVDSPLEKLFDSNDCCAGRQGRRWTWAPALGGVEGGQATGLRLSHASAFRADSSQKNKEETLYQSIDLSIMRLNMHQPLWRSLCQKKLAQRDLCWIVAPSCICDCNCLCVSMYV